MDSSAQPTQNRFSITRQLAYSREETKRALDLCAFINGLPVMSFEMKNSLTKQTVEDAIEQYKRDRDPRETLFEFGRCVVHFAVDDSKVSMCTASKGSKGMAKDSWFLPSALGESIEEDEDLRFGVPFQRSAAGSVFVIAAGSDDGAQARIFCTIFASALSTNARRRVPA